MEVLRPQLVEVLVDILVRQIAAQKHAVHQPIRPRQICQRTALLALVEHLAQSLQVETRRRPADQPCPTQVQRDPERVVRSDLLDRVDGCPPRKLDGLQQCVRARTRHSIPRRGAHAQSVDGRLGLLEVRAQAGHRAGRAHARADDVDVRELPEDLGPCPADVGLPVEVVLVLVRVDDGVVVLRLQPGILDPASFVQGLWLRWTPEERQVQPEELHQSQLGRARLVAQVRAHVVDAVVDAREHGHRNDGRAGTVLDDGPGGRRDAGLQHVHG